MTNMHMSIIIKISANYLDIATVSSCMNDNLHVYDIQNDIYYITEGATETLLPFRGSFFNNILENLRNLSARF